MGLFEQTFGLSGKTALVTGAAGGIGKAIAELMAGMGASVVLADRAREQGQQAAKEIVAAGGQAMFEHVDIGNEASIVALMASVKANQGKLDILVNNAALIRMQAIADLTAALWDEIQAVNARGTMLCVREAANIMRQGGRGGRIINIASVAALHPCVENSAAYAASKGAVVSFTKVAAFELAKDRILVNAVLPNAIDHPNVRRQFEDYGLPLPKGPSSTSARLPLGPGTPMQLAAAVAFLAGPGASYVSGQTLIVDGGFLTT